MAALSVRRRIDLNLVFGCPGRLKGVLSALGGFCLNE
jgi:hypothetical protein